MRFLFVLVIVTLTMNFGKPIYWLGLSTRHAIYPKFWSASICRMARRAVLSKRQSKLCMNPDKLQPFMPSIRRAADLAVFSCRSVFSTSRWNCSSILQAPEYYQDLTKSTAESAIVYAFASWAVVYQVAIDCMSHDGLCRCADDAHSTGRFKISDGKTFHWKGCQNYVREGMWVARRYILSEYKHILRMMQYGNTRLRNVLIRTKEYLHNSRIGVKVTKDSLRERCKCVGTSGSCSMKSCWTGLPKKGFSSIIETMRNLYKTSTFVQARFVGKRINLEIGDPHGIGTNGFGTEPPVSQLVYSTISPDYCTENALWKSPGTTGRNCNPDSQGPDGCSSMCCGRGYNSRVEKVTVKQCTCEFRWCCEVKCQPCSQENTVYTCL